MGNQAQAMKCFAAVVLLALVACVASDGAQALDANDQVAMLEEGLPKKVDGIAVSDLRKAVHKAVVTAVAKRNAKSSVKKDKKAAKAVKKKERKAIKKGLKAVKVSKAKSIKKELKKAT